MLERFVLGLCIGSIGLAGCGESGSQTPETLPAARKLAAVTLPVDPVERAATCSGAFMAKAQLRPDFETAGLSEADLIRVLHPVYLDATVTGELDRARLELGGNKAPQKAAEFRKNGRADAAIAECRQAEPSIRPGTFRGLPADPAQARAACVTLAAALVESYQVTEGVRAVSVPAYTRMIQGLDEPVYADLMAAGIGSEAEGSRYMRQAVAKAMRFGPPEETMQACLARFGS